MDKLIINPAIRRNFNSKLIQHYPNGKECAHCKIVYNMYNKGGNLWEKPIAIYPRHRDLSGLSIYNSHKHWGNSFLCVNGTTLDNDSEYFHNPMNVQSNLVCATYFIEYLNAKKGLTLARLIFNSKYAKYLDSKEHPHSILTVINRESAIKLFGEKSPFNIMKNYETDMVISVKPLELLQSNDFYRTLNSVVSKALGIEWDGRENDYYLFFDYIYDEKVGKILGKIAIPK